MPIRSRALKGALSISLALALAFLAFVFTVGMTRAPRAHAYGNTAVYQITFSLNCMNETLCQPSASNPFGIGGFWGWIELDANATGDGEAEGQGHSNANPMLNGAVHFALNDITWKTATAPDGSTVLLISAPAEFGPQPLVFPAAPGHYTFSFGPGTNNQIQITQVP